jgi:hypothetical protein
LNSSGSLKALLALALVGFSTKHKESELARISMGKSDVAPGRSRHSNGLNDHFGYCLISSRLSSSELWIAIV